MADHEDGRQGPGGPRKAFRAERTPRAPETTARRSGAPQQPVSLATGSPPAPLCCPGGKLHSAGRSEHQLELRSRVSW